MKRPISCLMLLFIAGNTLAQPRENAGPNIHLLRQIEGEYAYRTLSDDRLRGREHFQLLVHDDGSRTMMIWHDLWARNAQFTVVLRVAGNFRPLSAFASYWVENGYKGNVTFQVRGGRLLASGVGRDGPFSQDLPVPDQFSIGTHPVSGDGWHLWYLPDEPGSSGAINLFNVEATADLGKSMKVELNEMPYEVLGVEQVTVPAGTFEARRYRLMGATDVWVSGPDKLMIRMLMERFDREYVLTRLETTGQ